MGVILAALGPVGEELYAALIGSVSKHKAVTTALILEAARAADRLADLDDIIDGKDVLGLLRFRLVDDEGKVAEVKFDGVLSEARQQQANFGALMKAIIPNLDEKAGMAKERDVLDEIAQRRSARGAGSAKGAVRSRGSS